AGAFSRSRPFFRAGVATILQPPANGWAERQSSVLQHGFPVANSRLAPRTSKRGTFNQRQPDEAEVRATLREANPSNAHRIVGLSTLDHAFGETKKRGLGMATRNRRHSPPPPAPTSNSSVQKDAPDCVTGYTLSQTYGKTLVLPKCHS